MRARPTMRLKLKPVVISFLSLLSGGLLYAVLFRESPIYPSAAERWASRHDSMQLPHIEESHRNREIIPQRQLQNSPRYKFSTKPPFSFPQPHFSHPDWVLLRSNWVAELQDILSAATSNQISMVTATQEHQDVVANWLISAYIVADPPLENVLVLSLGESLHELLQQRNISSLYVSPAMVISPQAGIDSPFSQVHIVRLTVLRLILNYGFDVVNYDSDAILLKNPQIVFEKFKSADIIGTFGKGPVRLFKQWGVTLNTGVMLFRSNPKVEFYWESMSQLRKPTTDDQGNVNLALENLGITWMNFKRTQDIETFNKEIYGICWNHLIVTLLPFNIICRHTCTASRRKEYYVWHALAIKENRTVENKRGQARVGSAWFLREDWMERSQLREDISAVEWLRFITDWDVVQS